MPADTQLKLELHDHVQRARMEVKRLSRFQDITVYVTKEPSGFWLESRSYPGIEVEWTTLLGPLTEQQAQEIVDAGVCKPWMDCLAKRIPEPHINKGYDRDIPTELEKHLRYCQEGKFDGCKNLGYWAEAAVAEIRSLREQLQRR